MDSKSDTKRQRSPSYPYTTLERAIELAEKFYKKETRHKTTPDVAIEHLGYTVKSSVGIRALAALTSFGLLDASGLGADRQVGISELGRAILLDRRENSAERVKAIQEAALRPTIYRDLWSRWGSELPSKATIETVLLKEFHFNEAALDPFIKNMKATFEFAKLSEHNAATDEPIDSDNDGKGNSEDNALPKYGPRKSIDKPSAEVRDLTLPLIGGGMAFLQTPYPLSEENFDYMMMQLGNWKKALIADEGSTSENL